MVCLSGHCHVAAQGNYRIVADREFPIKGRGGGISDGDGGAKAIFGLFFAQTAWNENERNWTPLVIATDARHLTVNYEEQRRVNYLTIERTQSMNIL